MIRLDKYFQILVNGKERTAEIVGTYVLDEDIYMLVLILPHNDLKVYKIMPGGIKEAGKKISEAFEEALIEAQKQKEPEWIAR